MIETPKEIHASLPAQPSRGSSRVYMALIFILAGIEIIVSALHGYEQWAVLAAINALPITALLISKAATSLDLNKWMDSARKMVEAKYGGG